jgi:hypothetical protein
MRRNSGSPFHYDGKDSSARKSFTPSFGQIFKMETFIKGNDAVCSLAHHWLIGLHDACN